MNPRIRNLLVLVVVALVLAALTPAAVAQDKVELVFTVAGYVNELPGWRAQVDAANKLLESQNIVITMQEMPVTGWDEYYQKVTAQQAAGQPVDIGRIAESHMPIVIEREQALDLTDMLATWDMTQFYEEPFKSAAYRDGRYYGLPSGVYFMLMYYNRDLFDQAGLEYPSSDWTDAITFDQVREAAKAITTGEGANKTFGFSAGPYMAFIGMYTTSAGGNNVFTPEGECALTEEATVNVYNWFDSMLRDDQSQPRPTDTSVVSAWDMFKAGRIGMVVDGTWWLGDARGIDGFDVGLAAVPSAEGDAYSSAFVDSWVIWSGTQHPEEAKEALKALFSVEAISALAETGIGGIPVRKDVVENNIDQFTGETFADDDKATFMEALNHTLAVPYNSFYNEADSKINAELDAWLLGDLTAEQFAARSCEIIEQVRADQ